jgi:ribonuclease HII
LIGGDALSASIAAASIVAKVTRDRLMTKLAHLADCERRFRAMVSARFV